MAIEPSGFWSTNLCSICSELWCATLQQHRAAETAPCCPFRWKMLPLHGHLSTKVLLLTHCYNKVPKRGGENEEYPYIVRSILIKARHNCWQWPVIKNLGLRYSIYLQPMSNFSVHTSANRHTLGNLCTDLPKRNFRLASRTSDADTLRISVVSPVRIRQARSFSFAVYLEALDWRAMKSSTALLKN